MALSKTARRRQEERERRHLEDLKRYGDKQLPVETTPYLHDYEEAGKRLGLSAATVEKLCNQRKLAYLVRTWRHGIYLRRKRLIPHGALLDYMLAHYTYKPALP
jgi:hypothetical protein